MMNDLLTALIDLLSPSEAEAAVTPAHLKKILPDLPEHAEAMGQILTKYLPRSIWKSPEIKAQALPEEEMSDLLRFLTGKRPDPTRVTHGAHVSYPTNPPSYKVFLNKTALQKLTPDEAASLFAHEMAHNVARRWGSKFPSAAQRSEFLADWFALQHLGAPFTPKYYHFTGSELDRLIKLSNPETKLSDLAQFLTNLLDAEREQDALRKEITKLRWQKRRSRK